MITSFPRADNRLKSVCSSGHTLGYSDTTVVFFPLSTTNGRSPRVPAALASAVLDGQEAISCKSAECALEDRVRRQIVFHSDDVIPSGTAGAGRSRRPSRYNPIMLNSCAISSWERPTIDVSRAILPPPGRILLRISG